MAELANLQIVVGADVTQAERGLDTLSSKVSSTGSAMTAALGGALIGSTVALGAALVGSVKSAADFEKQMSAVSAVSGASASEMEALTKSALQLGKDTSFSATEAAQGIEELVKAGVSVADVMNGGARAALDLAAAGAIGVADAAEIASNAMNVFNIAGADMGHVADVIAGAANASAIGVNDYKFSLSAAGAVAAAVGIDFESLSTAIAVMGNAGIKGSDAGTSLKTMMMNLIPATNKQQDLFRELGILTFDVQRGLEGAAKAGIQPMTQDMAGLTTAMMDHLGISRDVTKWTKNDRTAYEELSSSIGLTKNEFFDATGKAKSFGEIAEVLKVALKDMTKEQQLATLEIMFGSDAIRAGAVMLEAGAKGFEDMAAAMGKVTAQQVAEERLNNLWGSLEKLKGSLETAAIMLGSMFTPALKGMADSATEFVNQAIMAIEILPDVWTDVVRAFDGTQMNDYLDILLTDVLGFSAGFAGAVIDVIRAAGELYRAVQPFLADLGVVFNELVRIFMEGGLAGEEAFRSFAAVFGPFAAAVEATVSVAGDGFRALVMVVQQALTGDIAGAFDLFLSLMGVQLTSIGMLLRLWGEAFVEWIAPMIPPVMEALGQFAADLLAWLAEQVPLLLAQLALWGAEFVAWVQPQIGPLLSALGLLGAAVLTWVGDQIQPIIAQLLLWGMEFVAWVAPQIPPLLSALGTLYVALWNWIIAQVPGITAKLVEWGILFGAWVIGVAIPELIKALPQIMTTLSEWIGTAAIEIAKLTLAMGVAVATGIVDGFLQAWPTIKGKITEAIGSIQLPSWLGGGGSSGMTSLSSTGGGKAMQYKNLIEQVSAEMGVPAERLAALIDVENSGERSVSPAGAKGIMQVVPGQGYDLPGEDAFDPLTSIRQGARALKDKHRITGSWDEAGAAYFGYGTDAGGMNTNTYRQRYREASEKYRSVAGPGPSGGGLSDVTQQLRVDQTAWAAGIKGAANICGPYAAAMFADFVGRPPTPQEAAQIATKFGWTPGGGMGQSDQVDDMANEFIRMANPGSAMRVSEFRTGDLGAASQAARAGLSGGAPVGFNTQAHYFVADQFDPDSGAFHVGATGTTMPGGGEWMTLSQINAVGQGLLGVLTVSGQLGPGFVEAGKQVTDGIGVIPPATAAVGTSVTDLATSVTAQTGLMSQAVLTSVTNMGAGIMTTTHDSAGSVITTITDMQGQVTSQYATLANGAVLTMGDMAAGVLTSTTDLGTGVMTTVQDMSGNYITTITDLQGNVTSQYTTLAASATAATAEMGAGVTAEVATMAGTAVSTVTQMDGAIMTTAQDMAGNLVTTITDMAGNVLSQYTSMASSAEQTASESNQAFGEIKKGASEVGPAVEQMGDSWKNLPKPNVSGIVSEFKKIEKAAEDAADAVNELGEHTGSKSGSGKGKDIAKRATGGPVNFGEMYLVGEQGPELFSPYTSGHIIPNHKISAGGGGDTYVVSVNVSGSLLANRRDIEEAVIVGLESAQRRGRI